MQKKRIRRLSTLIKKASRLLKVPILLARMRQKSVHIRRLIVSIKKSGKMTKFLLDHYSHDGYLHEYQFSPSNGSTSFIHYYCHRKRAFKKRRRYEDLYSIFPIGKCLGIISTGSRECGRDYPLMELKSFPACNIENSIVAREYYNNTSGMSGEIDDDDDSIDERAEKFIERFYEEIRMQRRESILKSNPFILDVD